LTSSRPLAAEPTSDASSITVTARIASIDIFRGLTVLVMIFVDNLGLVKGLPWWTYHMPAEANGMTYVDMVFPAFLFLMGMSIPLSIEARTVPGSGQRNIWAHVIQRSLALVVLGLFIANAPAVDAQYTHVSGPWWTTLGFLGIALLLIRFPGSERYRTAALIQRCCGLLVLVGLAIVFRRTTAAGQVAWLDFSDWEILGLLGWAYLLVATMYLLLQKRFWLLLSALPVLVAINALSVAGRLGWLKSLPFYLSPFEAGLSSMTLAGLLASLVLVGGVTGNRITPNLPQKAGWMVGSATVLFFAGWLLRPLGVSKIHDTPTWCLYCIAANLVIVLLFNWLADVRHGLRWTGFLQVVGANALLAYFLPYTAYLLPKLGGLTADGTSGAVGIARSAAFTALILVIVLGLKRARIRLQI
jgi:heparan-alpha-glucosaminide N-acetyltransferase